MHKNKKPPRPYKTLTRLELYKRFFEFKDTIAILEADIAARKRGEIKDWIWFICMILCAFAFGYLFAVKHSIGG